MGLEELSYQQLLNQLQQKEADIQQLESQLAAQQDDILSHRQRSELLDFALDAVISSDLDFNITSWNRAAEKLYGWTVGEVLGKNAVELFQTEYFDDAVAQDEQFKFRQNGIWRGHVIHHHKDGTPIPVRVHTSLIYDDRDEVTGFVTVLQDISQELADEDEFLKNTEFYKIIAELTSDYAYLYHIDEYKKWHHVWTTEESFQQVTGYTANETIDGYDLYHPDDVEMVKQDIERTIMGENTEGEYRIITKDGTIKWINIRRRVMWNANQDGVIGFYGAGKDITARKFADEQLKAYEVEQERISILRNFIHDASHDLKTPLSTVNTSIYILRQLATTKKQEAQLDKLEFHVNRLAQLIEDMFEMSRLDLLTSLPLVSIDINLYLRDLIISRQEFIDQKHIEFITRVSSSPIHADADAGTFMRAIANIIDNAIQYTPENGHITIHSYEEDDWVVIMIQDDGMGIAEDELDQIFVRFFRGDQARGTNSTATTGLGLSIADKIIKLHNGRIDVNSTPGKGACFYVRLPQKKHTPFA